MELTKLNPRVRSAILYDRVGRSDERVAYDCRLIYMISGDLTVTVGKDKPSHLGAGDLLFIPAGTTYKLKGKYVRFATFSFDLTHDFPEDCDKPVTPAEFAADKCRVADDSAPFDKVISLSGMESERAVIEKMCHSFVSAEGAYLAEASARLKLLLLGVAECSDEHALPTRMVETLDEYIRDNVGEEISNTEIAAMFGYHPFYVSNVLKAAKGQTLRQYIISYRLKLAASMLAYSERSISEIADACGFTDASYFTKTFRQGFGETPKEYRNRFKDELI
jgi:AraC-like DNA-binding protein